ncbi:MAG: NIPSNAP family protein [Alphaproteobacteria bacterium]|nr:NIPSNAP family protein [Alphaproteobacteria bacterium]
MALYEMRTYTLHVGMRGEAVALYAKLGWPALKKYEKKLVGYFLSDTGTLNQIVHLWKFDDDADRRRHWAQIYDDKKFMAFAGKLRPLILTQENQLLNAAPWGPHP